MVIKILHYLPHLGLGGTEKTCELFFKHASKDFDVAVAYEATGNLVRLPQFNEAAKVCGGRLFEVNSYRDYDPNGPRIPNPLDLQIVINDFKPDILHVYRSGYEEFPEPGIHIQVPHFVETNVFGHYDSNILVDRSLFMSEWLMNNTLRRLSPISRSLLPRRFNFINNPVEMPCTDAKLPIRERWGDKVIALGRVGRPDNGIYNAVNVEAARLLRMQGYDVRFIVVAPPSNMLDDLARYDIPFCAIEPTVDSLVLSMAYNSMDIFAHARADGETGGVAIQESTIHKKPVVTHIATPSFSGMGVFQAQTRLVENNKTGFVVNNNAAEYANALKILIDNIDLRLKFGDSAYIKALQEYEVTVCQKKLENIYKACQR